MSASKKPPAVPSPSKPKKPPVLPPVRLRIHVLRMEHGYKSMMDLWKKLNSMGVTISHSQLTRIANNQADMLDRKLLAAFAHVFKCSVKDLFEDS